MDFTQCLRRPYFFPRHKSDAGTDRHHYRNTKLMIMIPEPLILLWGTHSDQKNIGVACIDRGDDRFVAEVDEAVMGTGNNQTREQALKLMF